MAPAIITKIASLISQEREVLLTRWREQVRRLASAQLLDKPTLDDHIPGFLDQLALILRSKSEETIPERVQEAKAQLHGLQRLHDGFDLEEVVAEYNILRGCVHELVDERGLGLEVNSVHIINRVIDEGIGLAVQTYATQRSLEVQRKQEEHLTFVAHDLKTPLNSISLAASILENRFSGDSSDPQSSRMLKILRRNVQQLNNLIDTVIKANAAFQPKKALHVERRHIELWPLIESLIYDLHLVAETANAAVLNEVPEDLTVLADAGLLRRVFQNLLSNGIKYAPRGEVRVGAKITEADGSVECWVSDNGTGIPEDRLGTVFDKFETSDEENGSTGLGLAIVKQYVEAHGGTLSVESTQGAGSTFRFTLPRENNPPTSQ